MQDRHINRKINFEEQAYTTLKYVIPFIEQQRKIKKGLRILEIGCGEAGNLKPFLEKGCICVGVDLSESKIESGRQLYAKHYFIKNLTLVTENIYNWNNQELFDIVIMRDVLEHIHNHQNFFTYSNRFLKNDGVFFIGFAPWQSPFGGHQQICKNKILSRLPYFHLLPNKLYFSLIKNTNETKINELIEIKETRISIEKYLKLIKKSDYSILKRSYFLINPNYKIKFGLKPTKQFLYFIPWIRNFIITAGYFLLVKEK